MAGLIMQKKNINMLIHQQNDIEFTFELWGGVHKYNKMSKTYTINRPYGIFSNMTVSIYGIFILEKNGHKVNNLVFILNEYIPDIDLYDELFKLNPTPINLNKFDDLEILSFESNCFPTSFGLTWDIINLNLKITNEIINKFFTPSINVVSLYEKILKEKHIDLQNTLFIWARKTDKITETKIPEVKEYIRVINENKLQNKNIILQTDDILVFEDFKKEGLDFNYLEVIPFSNNSNAFHGRLDTKTNEYFIEKYGISKLEYIKLMFVSSLICKNSNSCILYPGNPTTYIPMIRNSFKNCFLFKNNNSYLNFN